ncbi:MAG TPA: L-lactate permease [Arthrobacter sp.]|nr:L-lactate permease [Arthrobacter sp.]
MVQAAAAAVPIVLAVLLFFLGVRATRVSLYSLGTGIAMALAFFPTPWSVVLGSLSAFAPTIVEILLILYAGVLLSRIMSSTGAMSSISSWLHSSAPSTHAGTVLVVFGLVPFAESVTGFGIGVTVGVPILRLLGHSVPRSTIFALLGLLAVPWGALGPGTLLAAELSGTTLQDVGVRSALLSGPVMLGAALLLTVLLRRDERIGRLFLASTGSAVLLWAGILGANTVAGTPLAGVLGSLLVIGVHLAAYRLQGSLVPAGPTVVRSAAPYAVMAAGLLAARAATAPLEANLAVRAVSSPAIWLIVACVTAQYAAGRGGQGGGYEKGLLHRAGLAYRTWRPVGVVTLCFTVLGSLLAATGMSAALGAALAGAGEGYLLAAPAINALAGFITGSNTAANAMLTATQSQVATALGSSVLQMVAATNVAASLATMAAPSRLLLAYELAVATPAGQPTGPARSSGPGPGREALPSADVAAAEADAESRVNRWVLPRIFALVLAVSLVLGAVTAWVS